MLLYRTLSKSRRDRRCPDQSLCEQARHTTKNLYSVRHRPRDGPYIVTHHVVASGTSTSSTCIEDNMPRKRGDFRRGVFYRAHLPGSCPTCVQLSWSLDEMARLIFFFFKVVNMPRRW
ncbi:hypothetical protein VTN49DRAFT_4856 [Thermomyces lanuginosus]|uniref:uncharacterized protein n=1 Tax=Thermomyces lanuginosus TaxID=5541 RepID=UPI003743D3C4